MWLSLSITTIVSIKATFVGLASLPGHIYFLDKKLIAARKPRGSTTAVDFQKANILQDEGANKQILPLSSPIKSFPAPKCHDPGASLTIYHQKATIYLPETGKRWLTVSVTYAKETNCHAASRPGSISKLGNSQNFR